MGHPNSYKHGRNLRIGRYSSPGQVYLLTTVTADRRPLFTNYDVACTVARTLHYYHQNGRCHTWAWVLMPDHLHWLVALEEDSSLAGLMRSFKGYMARQLNGRAKSPGRHVWQAGFHDHAARRDEDMRKMARYIVANPLRAGLVDKIGDYPFWDAAWL
jgi:REP element-mobilizing transposase RayT